MRSPSTRGNGTDVAAQVMTGLPPPVNVTVSATGVSGIPSPSHDAASVVKSVVVFEAIRAQLRLLAPPLSQSTSR